MFTEFSIGNILNPNQRNKYIASNNFVNLCIFNFTGKSVSITVIVVT